MALFGKKASKAEKKARKEADYWRNSVWKI